MSFCVSAASDSFSTVVVAADALKRMLYLCFRIKRTDLEGLSNGFGVENERRQKKEERRWRLLARSMFGRRESEGKRGKNLMDFFLFICCECFLLIILWKMVSTHQIMISSWYAWIPWWSQFSHSHLHKQFYFIFFQFFNFSILHLIFWMTWKNKFYNTCPFFIGQSK